MTTTPRRPRPARLPRPRSVTILGWLIVLYGLGLLLVIGLALLILALASESEDLAQLIRKVGPGVGQLDALLGASQGLLGVFMIAAGVGILRLRSWAWLLAMVVHGVNLAILLIEYRRGLPSYWEMLLSTGLVFLLNQREVQRAFSVAQHRDEPTSLRTAQEDVAAARETQESLARRG